jgi:hypothetical protein
MQARAQTPLRWSVAPLSLGEYGSVLEGSGTWSANKLFIDPTDEIAVKLSTLGWSSIRFGESVSASSYLITLGYSPTVDSLFFWDNYSLTSASPFTLTLRGDMTLVDAKVSIGGNGSPLALKLENADRSLVWELQNTATPAALTVGAAVDFNGTNLILKGSVDFPGASAVLSGSLNIGSATLSIEEKLDTTLSGSMKLTSGSLLINSTGSTLLSGQIEGGSLATLVKQGGGVLTVSNVQGLNAFGAGIMLTQGSLVLATDTSVDAPASNVNFTSAYPVTLAVTRTATGQNRTVTLGGLYLETSQDLTVSPSNGYGLVFAGTSTVLLNAAFNVTGTQPSNVLAGLTLSGLLTGTLDGTSTLQKKGTGTMRLTNEANNFGPASGFTFEFLLQGGILAASSDGALGSAVNNITLATGSATQGFRAEGDITTSRAFTLQSTSGIEVVAGKTLKLLTPFTPSSAGTSLQKNDNGTLELAAANT